MRPKLHFFKAFKIRFPSCVGILWPCYRGHLGPSGPKWQRESEISSRGLSATGAQKVQKKKSKKSQNSWKIVGFDSFSTPFWTFWVSPGPRGPGASISEAGRVRFRGARFQTPNSVSFSGLTEFRGANSVNSSQPIICVPKRTHRVFRRTHRVCPKTQWGSVSSLLRNSTLETVFRYRFLL